MSSGETSITCPLCRHANHDGRGCGFNTMDEHGAIGWCQCAIMTPRCTRHVGVEVVLTQDGHCSYCSHIEQYEKLMDRLRQERDEARALVTADAEKRVAPYGWEWHVSHFETQGRVSSSGGGTFNTEEEAEAYRKTILDRNPLATVFVTKQPRALMWN